MSEPGVGRVIGLDALAHIRIVLNRPTHPGNIGAVARAMKTMCKWCKNGGHCIGACR